MGVRHSGAGGGRGKDGSARRGMRCVDVVCARGRREGGFRPCLVSCVNMMGLIDLVVHVVDYRFMDRVFVVEDAILLIGLSGIIVSHDKVR